ncbi:uncharacterized protein MONOS_12707 [Monocercomonoides exilis]|uniref:uncharacterized protein n=1 Tax=Monocercomonoides exilis TaxID=2049356 RepID=UPI003559B101|nr:hypothetical protein MONOS_12707 [Monocercomonoides exilis]|eukprot:MONOS_12707.1-p1 / transcript=MONOS_12707.1 / gene=MONOS_12707 / organism=Monocercomonoides_exilis_PA203 / gene_product=unspecified product / transcript_product=unspecified product / location=Mono_scaffold00722:14285-14911(-) / protein_length=162 / sequence_SO=supercontig / SO=protein_coding / is_pseudo=false
MKYEEEEEEEEDTFIAFECLITREPLTTEDVVVGGDIDAVVVLSKSAVTPAIDMAEGTYVEEESEVRDSERKDEWSEKTPFDLHVFSWMGTYTGWSEKSVSERVVLSSLVQPPLLISSQFSSSSSLSSFSSSSESSSLFHFFSSPVPFISCASSLSASLFS